MAAKHVDRVLTAKFAHCLTTALNGRRVVATNTRGIFLQVAYEPPPLIDLTPRPLDLTRQPSPLHVPIGTTARGPLWLSLVEMDAVLVGGARRMGKTRLLHGWIQALIRGGAAQLVLWDGKGGVEFGRYAGAERVVWVNELAEGLQVISAEMARRVALFRAAGVPALPEYTARTKDTLPVLILVVDEIAGRGEEPYSRVTDADRAALSDLVSRGGAFGVHPVLATQRPDVAAVQSLVKGNLSTRIALPVPSTYDSRVILGHSGAEKLAKEKGRLLLTWEGRRVEAQSFLVELPAGSGEREAPASLLTAAERRLARAALEELDGWFHIKGLVTITGESERRVSALARRWGNLGYLTDVQRNDQGHVVGRQVTDALRRVA